MATCIRTYLNIIKKTIAHPCNQLLQTDGLLIKGNEFKYYKVAGILVYFVI
jgi:hypothetical protein